MSLFQKASKKADRVKMYIYGGPGTGKTITSLHFPSPAVVDAEGGTLHYGHLFDFHRIETNDPKVVHKAIDELLENPGDFKSFIIDPMTLVYDKLVQSREETMKLRSGNIHYELQPLDYKPIKNEVRILTNKLLSLDMNVIVTARSKPLYVKGGKFMEQQGNQAEGHKDMPYMFDIIIELYVDEATGKRFAKVDKDRTNSLPAEFEFSYDTLVQHLGIDSLERKADKAKQASNLNEKNARSTKIKFNGKTVYTAGITAETLKAIETHVQDVDPDKLEEVLLEKFNAGSLLDLNERAGQILLTSLISEDDAEESED